MIIDRDTEIRTLDVGMFDRKNVCLYDTYINKYAFM